MEVEYEEEMIQEREIEEEVVQDVKVPQVKALYRYKGQGMGIEKGEVRMYFCTCIILCMHMYVYVCMHVYMLKNLRYCSKATSRSRANYSRVSSLLYRVKSVG